MSVSPEDYEQIVSIAERIARAFIDRYHEEEGVFDRLKAEGDDPLGLTPYANSVRGGIAVMMELGIYEGGEHAHIAERTSDS